MARSRRRHPTGSRRGGQFAPDIRGANPPASNRAPRPPAGDEPGAPDVLALAESWSRMYASAEDLSHEDFEELEWANTYHLRFTRFHTGTLQATAALLDSRPSRLLPAAQQEAFEEWIASVTTIYKMPPVALVWDEQAGRTGGGFYVPATHTLTLNPNRPSVITLLHEMRHALQYQQCGPALISDDLERDARAWSLSLYFQVRPEQFKTLVRAGRIRFIDRRAFG